jgi:tetratricopeptide (TPR) repeat protein
MGNAAAGAGLALLMTGDRQAAAEWFDHAHDVYRASWDDAPAGSWGRAIAMLKARILVGDWPGAEDDARWTLEQAAAKADSPIGRYAASLALLTLGEWEEARVLADGLRTRDDFPPAVGDALAAIAADDPLGYTEAIESVLESFETREEHLEDVPVADTVLVLQALARRRDLTVELSSPLLPG